MDDGLDVRRFMSDPPAEVFEISRREAVDLLAASRGFVLFAVVEEDGEAQLASSMSTGPDLGSGELLSAVYAQLVNLIGMVQP